MWYNPWHHNLQIVSPIVLTRNVISKASVIEIA